MAKVTIHLAPRGMMSVAAFGKAETILPVIKNSLPEYEQACSFDSEHVGQDAAEDAFDLTNNPGRQEQREKIYGRGRSVSTGDVIEVDGEKYACMSIGWVQL